MTLSKSEPSPLSQDQDMSSSLEAEDKEFNYKNYYFWMNKQLKMRMPALAVALLGNPTYKRPTEWRYGSKRHLVVHIDGRWKGRFHDFETGESGDALELVKTKTGYTGKALSDWVQSFIGYVPKSTPKEEQDWRPIIPVPFNALKQNLEVELINSMTHTGMQEVARYCYKDLSGNIVGFVVRFEGRDSKLTLPLTYCRNKTGQLSWRWKGFPVPRMPYGAEYLKDTTKTILIVEGEKTADAARNIFSDLIVLSWVGGTGSVHLTDWGCLAHREVILWPDHDDPGIKCIEKLKETLKAAKINSVRVVQLPLLTPKGWDLADSLPRSWNQQTLHDLFLSAI